jgi:glyoxylase-like metal-dependent hydrolase (beta-lactamase superfamily II)
LAEETVELPAGGIKGALLLLHHPRFGDFLIDTGFDDSFAKHPPYGSYTEAMKFFNWANGVTNRQEPGMDLAAHLARLNVHPKAVFFTHLHPDHTGGVSALGPQTEFVFGKAEASFLARAAVANHFPANAKFFSIDFPGAPSMLPLGPCVDLLGDGSFWARCATRLLNVWACEHSGRVQIFTAPIGSRSTTAPPDTEWSPIQSASRHSAVN